MQIKPRQFTPDQKPKRYLTPTSTQISYSGYDETISDYNTKSCSTSQEKKTKDTSSLIKERVLNKLRIYIQNREQDSQKSYQFNLQLEKIGKLSSQELANIYLQHTTNKFKIPRERNRTTPKQMIYNYKETNQGQLGYQQLYHKKHGNIQFQQNQIPKIIDSPSIKEMVIRSDVIYDSKQNILTEKILMLSKITRDKDLQSLQIELDKKQQDLNEIDLQILGIKMDIRQINNQTLKANWEHQDQIRKLEDELSDHNKNQESKEQIYSNLIPELNTYQEEDSNYQTQFHVIMEEINSLKKIKKIYDPSQDDQDQQQNRLQQLIQENIQLKSTLQTNLDNQIKNDKLSIPEMFELQQQNKQKIEEMELSNNQQNDKKVKMKQSLQQFIQNKQINSVYMIADQQPQKLDDDIVEVKAKKILQQQEINDFTCKFDTQSKDQINEISKQQQFINSMVLKLQELLKKNSLQEQQCQTQVDDKKKELMLIQVQNETLQNSTTSNEIMMEKQNQAIILQQNKDYLSSQKAQNQSLNQKNKEAKEQLLKIKEEVRKNSENKDILTQIEKMDKQSEIISRQVNDRIAQQDQCRAEIQKIKDILSAQKNPEDVELLEKLKILQDNNDKRIQEVLKLKDSMVQLQMENGDKEAMMMKYRRECEKIMVKLDDYSTTEHELRNKIKILDKQLAEK